MLSPAKCEKLGVPKDMVSQLTTRAFKGVNLSRKDTAEIGNKIFNKQ
jgi:hypothetical protein